MKTQIIKGQNGLPAGVFIPIDDWEKVKKQYPDIEKTKAISQTQKEISVEQKTNLAYNKKSDRFKDFLDILD